MVIGLEPLKLSGTALERRQKKEIEQLRAALTKLETEIRNRGDAERLYIELIEAALANES